MALKPLDRRHALKAIIAGDIVAVILASSLAFIIGSMIAPGITGWEYPSPIEGLSNRYISFPVAIAVMLWRLDARSHYSGRQPFWIEARDIGAALFFAFLVEGFVQYMGRDQLSRIWIVSTWLIAYPVVLVTRRIAKNFVLASSGGTAVLVLGSASDAAEAGAALAADKLMGYRIVGTRSMPSTDRLEEIIAATGAEKVVVVLSDLDSSEASKIATLLTRIGVPFSFAIPSSVVGATTMDSKTLIGHDVVFLTQRSGLMRPAAQVIKRITDILVSGSALALVWPFLAAVAIKVRSDGGPAIYGHERVGRAGASFRCLKFRSMGVDAGEKLDNLLSSDEQARREWEKNRKLTNDPRVTRFGRFMRSTAIDELPQLWNVLIGDMSLVGPRPVTMSELSLNYGDAGATSYLAVRPGLTGLWQASGRNEIDYRRRVEMDSWYVRNWSTWIDLVLIVKTIPTLLARRGSS